MLVCDPVIAPNVKSISFEMYLINPVTNAVIQSFNSIENNAPYLQFGNAGYTKLYTLNDPVFGFYSPSGTYDGGFPKGKYNYRIRAYNKTGVDYGPYPSNVTRNVDPTASILAEGNYYIDVTNAMGARVSAEEFENEFAIVAPNPVSSTLTTVIKGSKGQTVKWSLTDITGRTLLEKEITPMGNEHREQVDVSSHATGIYFVQVASPSQKATLKVIKIAND